MVKKTIQIKSCCKTCAYEASQECDTHFRSKANCRCSMYRKDYSVVPDIINQWNELSKGDVIRATVLANDITSMKQQRISVTGEIIFKNRYYITILTRKKLKYTFQFVELIEGSKLEILEP